MKLDSLDEKTKRNYEIAFRNFERFFGDNAINQLKNRENRYNLLQGWVNSNLKTMTPNATKSYFSRIKQYLNHCGIEISSEQVKANLRFPKNHTERFYAISIEDIQKILDNSDYKHKTMYLCQLSGGLRIGELVQLRKEDLTPKDGRFIVEIPSKIAKNHKGRITFFSFEASKYLKQLLKKLDDNDQIFGTNENSFHSEINEEQIFRRALNRAGLTKKYSITGRFKIVDTAFTRLIFASVVPTEDPGEGHFENNRLKLTNMLQSIIYAKMWFVLQHTFGNSDQVTKSALRDLSNSLGWTSMTWKPNYEKDYFPKRILDFPAPYVKR